MPNTREKWEPLTVMPSQRRYDAMLGVGGIGAGVFFALSGDHTLGREESRGGHFLDRRDYCKLHIISHYVQVLLGSTFSTYPIGKVGTDKEGRQLLAEIEAAGLDSRYLETADGQTLFSFCFVYTDGSGGNLTTDDSVNSTVDAAFVNLAQPTFAAYAKRGVALVVPEAPLEARLRLIELGQANDFFCVAAFTSAELTTELAQTILQQTNLVALNLDEAAAIAHCNAEYDTPLAIVRAAIARLSTISSDLLISITAGGKGSWTWDGWTLHHQPVIETNVAGTAGAGDAFLSGLIVGIVADLHLTHAQELATVCGALSVTSPHTIHPELDRRSLKAFAETQNITLSDEVLRLFKEPVVENGYEVKDIT